MIREVSEMKEEEIQKRIARANALHESGCNCAQAVVCAFSDVLGEDESTLFRVSEAFGLGMGRMDTCGAVTGMYMVTGLAMSSGGTDQGITKGATLKKTKELGDAFAAKNGSMVCRELKGVGTGKTLRSCPGCIEDAVRILGEQLL